MWTIVCLILSAFALKIVSFNLHSVTFKMVSRSAFCENLNLVEIYVRTLNTFCKINQRRIFVCWVQNHVNLLTLKFDIYEVYKLQYTPLVKLRYELRNFTPILLLN